MGINSSAQFLGAFAGGALGGVLLTQSVTLSWGILATLMAIALVMIFPIASPPYLTSLTVTLPQTLPTGFADLASWSQQITAVAGVEEMVIMQKEGIAYLKVDKAQLNDTTRQHLSHILAQPLAI